MAVVGIVAEYNPFHNGHKLQLEYVRETFDPHAIVVAMSASFVQRGEPAVLDKWTRAENAVSNGADLVLELPAYYSLQSAQGFAQGAVKLLAEAGVDLLCFGSESGDIESLERAAGILTSQPQAFRESLRQSLRQGQSYAAAAAMALGDPALSTPNNILAIQYIIGAAELGGKIRCHTHQRETSKEKGLIGAHTIRAMLAKGDDVGRFTQWATGPITTINDFEQLICYKLRISDPLEYPDSGDGLGQRLRRHKAGDLHRVLCEVKTRRFTMARIKRLLLNILLDNKLSPGIAPGYIRPLAMNSTGARLLKQRLSLPVVTRGAKFTQNNKLWELEQRATDIYSLPAAKGFGMDMLRHPII